MPSMVDVDMKHIKNKILEKIRLGVGVKSSNNIESGSENTLMQRDVPGVPLGCKGTWPECNSSSC